ncbi:hypothetical protein C0Q70_20665, partial [Pomacea canaliculata]
IHRLFGYRSVSSYKHPFCPSCQSRYFLNGHLDFRIEQVRCMSGGQRNFFQQVIDNIKQELNKNKEMKESLKKFREERQKLEESEALKKARQKFENIEAETASLKKALGGIKEKVSETVEELQKTEVIKKGREITEELGKTAGRAAETLSKSGQQITQTSAYKSVSQGVKAVKEEFDDVTLSKARVYRAPGGLESLLSVEYIKTAQNNQCFGLIFREAMGMVLHKDSRFYQSWQNFKDNNQYVTKLFDLKVKYDESDNIMIRTTRAFTDKLSQMFGGLFTKTEMSEVLTEVCKVDPTFNKEAFVRICERDIIPNILEALIRGDLEILQDWCHEAPFNTLAHPIKQALAAGYRFDSKVLDISNVDDKTLRVMYVWALCRDQEELDPIAAWKLMDISASTSEQWL